MYDNFFRKSYIYEIMWTNTRRVQTDKPQLTVWRLLIARWVTKATNSMATAHCTLGN